MRMAEASFPLKALFNRTLKKNNPAPILNKDCTKEALRENAFKAVASILREPDQLEALLPDLLKTYRDEKRILESQISSILNHQVEDIHSSMAATLHSNNYLFKIKDNLKNIDSLCTDASFTMEHFGHIRQISLIHQNIAATSEVYERFSKLNEELERVANLIERETASNNLKHKTGENLLLIHYYLFKLEEFRNHSLSQVKTFASLEITELLTTYFKKLDVLKQKFEDHFWSRLVAHFLHLVFYKNTELIVKIILIIEKEETEDMLLLKRQQLSEKRKLSKSYPATIINMNRELGNFRQRFVRTLHEQIARRFEDHVGNEENTFQLFQKLNFYIADLKLVQETIATCFPLKYHIVDVWVIDYHKNIYNVLSTRLLHRELSPLETLKLLEWVQDYLSVMKSKFDVAQEMLEPAILDERTEQMLTSRYIGQSRQKMSTWLVNLFSAEQKVFLSRDAQPERDSNGKYMAPLANDLFVIIRQIIEPTIQASKGKLLYEIVRETMKCVLEYQSKYMRMIQTESAKSLESLNSGLEDYLIMMGNTVLKWIEYLDELGSFVDIQVDPFYRIETLECVKSVHIGFVALLTTCRSAFTFCVISVIKPVTSTLFTDVWYSDADLLMKKMIATLDDYFQDFQITAIDFQFSAIVLELLEKILIVYIQQLKSKNTLKLKLPIAYQLIVSNLNVLRGFFTHYASAENVAAYFLPIEKLLPIISTSRKMLFLDWFSLWKSYPDINLDLIEDLLAKRDDLDRAFIKELMETCKSKAKEETVRQFGVRDYRMSFFSKIK